jgi:hypothetical protein
MNQSERYKGKPFLRLLEFYVLWCIGELHEETEQALIEMTPKLRETYLSQGTWWQIIEAVMQFPPDFVEAIRIMRKENLEEITRAKLSPQEFAEVVADKLIAR